MSARLATSTSALSIAVQETLADGLGVLLEGSGETFRSFTYGKITPTSYTDPEVVAVNKALARFGQAMIQPGAYLVARGDCKARLDCVRNHNHDDGHTNAQARLQEELENVVGLPTFDDQKMLPQITAFMLGSLRWRPVDLGALENI
ncbi:uncharacterized protein F5891DRAFT_1280129 [Suillus fuscotomentosus]|uniref:Uncharacterized protein n=1 Tax=Suillus fuscotomentosus TaxID=1912939 RepID=A0AAD4E0B8_9AGAM|nr:uncharacterized protein F5891DRAFT_1280129 [Suillus fuscotomentosus]KAG1897385.1 hypothetical protein F5891DRAFT_1280129 [Suillus fuscotomentosus]